MPVQTFQTVQVPVQQNILVPIVQQVQVPIVQPWFLYNGYWVQQIQPFPQSPVRYPYCRGLWNYR